VARATVRLDDTPNLSLTLPMTVLAIPPSNPQAFISTHYPPRLAQE
jgi:hypothetical protein